MRLRDDGPAVVAGDDRCWLILTDFYARCQCPGRGRAACLFKAQPKGFAASRTAGDAGSGNHMPVVQPGGGLGMVLRVMTGPPLSVWVGSLPGSALPGPARPQPARRGSAPGRV